MVCSAEWYASGREHHYADPGPRGKQFRPPNTRENLCFISPVLIPPQGNHDHVAEALTIAIAHLIASHHPITRLAMASTCTYDCWGTAPPLSPNSDITGVGVPCFFEAHQFIMSDPSRSLLTLSSPLQLLYLPFSYIS